MMDSGMPGDKSLIAATRDALVERWQVRHGEGADSDWEVLLAALTERILDLLVNNPNKLMTSLYVLDIAEHVYRAAMGLDTMEARAAALARAILDRESRKIASRRKYANPAPEAELEDKRGE